MRIVIASIAAAAVQLVVFIARIAPDVLASSTPVDVDGLGPFLGEVVVVAAAAVLVLGVPTFLLLRKIGRVNWTSLAIAGFCLGMLPVAFFWPRHVEGYSAGGTWHGKSVATYIDGVPTSYAWLAYAEDVFYFGVHGLIGALIFYAVWRRLGRVAVVPL